MDQDEAAHHEPPHLCLLCLQTELALYFSVTEWGSDGTITTIYDNL